MTIEIKATERFLAVVLFITLYKMDLTFFESEDKILKCEHSFCSFRQQPSRSTILHDNTIRKQPSKTNHD